jgi:hypothetical protein
MPSLLASHHTATVFYGAVQYDASDYSRKSKNFLPIGKDIFDFLDEPASSNSDREWVLLVLYGSEVSINSALPPPRMERTHARAQLSRQINQRSESMGLRFR